ncbi:FRG domain-containing protein [[Ruminococcus] torques]|uniref:FRG domain-containing protein n=1 Tax=[Ruminococcus] torques TaxID=33039 RepID=UPI0025A36DCB|nr:FRG domain-containing protein [[Ruminococcus] torques]MDM8236718.1 FRG domain-containing protein [[Ruminococcus] torques]
MVEIEITSIDILVNQIEKMRNKYGNQPIWFRGQENSEWGLIPSIQRGNLIKQEQFISNDFYIYVNQIKDESPSKTNYAGWMSLMQHYGLPTRILDWSSSPLVACYFALEKNRDKKNDECVYPIDALTVQNMLLPAFKSNVEIDEDLQDKIIACHSVEKNLRMYSQQSSFTVHNSRKRLEDICDSETLFKFIIPYQYKEKLYKSTTILGISTSFIYPDMEHISKDIIKKYSE